MVLYHGLLHKCWEVQILLVFDEELKRGGPMFHKGMVETGKSRFVVPEGY